MEETQYLESTLTLGELTTPSFALLKRKYVGECFEPEAKRQRAELSRPINSLKKIQIQSGKENRGQMYRIALSKVQSGSRNPLRKPLGVKQEFQSICPSAYVKPQGSTTVLSEQRISKIPSFAAQQTPSMKNYKENPVSHYVTRPDLYDSSWLSQQEIVFTQLMNSTFEKANLNISTKVHTRDHANLLRKLTFAIFQSECSIISQKIATILDKSTLRAKKDVDLCLDIGLFRQFSDLCLCYRTEWLALGLEVVTGHQTTELLNALPSQLESFILQFVVKRNGVVQGCNPRDVAIRFTISRFLLLVLVLDIAKRRNIIKGCLFTQTSPYKSSTQLLEKFSSVFLCSEGEIIRRLSLMGYHVDYVQTPLDEYDYRVRNLAVDLRDGVRLARLIELFKGEDSLFPGIKYPAKSKVHKLHNVALVLSYLRHRSVSLLTKDKQAILPEDIVLGHREKSLTVIWKIVSKWNLPSLLHTLPLGKEIQHLHKQIRQAYSPEIPLDSMEGLCEAEALLFKWAKAVCTIYGTPLSNLSTSLTDGRVFAVLLWHYTSPRTTLPRPSFLGNSSKSLKVLSEKLGLSSLLSNLGFFKEPQLQFLDKNCAIVCLAMLASSLLLFSKSSQAAYKIQRAWKFYLFNKKIKVACDGYYEFWLVKKEQSQREAQTYHNKIRMEGAITIQRLWRGFVERKQFHRMKYAVSIIIQRYRVYAARKYFFSLKHAVAVIELRLQAKLKERKAHKDFLEMRASLITLQARALGYLTRRVVKMGNFAT